MSFHLKPASKGLLFTGPLSAMATTLSRLPAAVVPPPLLLQPPVPTSHQNPKHPMGTRDVSRQQEGTYRSPTMR